MVLGVPSQIHNELFPYVNVTTFDKYFDQIYSQPG